MSQNIKDAALVVFSGGADSTICLHWALKKFKSVHAITFDYQQRHSIEIEAASRICQTLDIPHKIIPINSLKSLGGNSLINHQLEIQEAEQNQLPNTFVPGRNLIFLTLAGAWCYQLKVNHLVTGVCQTDYSGYPDCRESTIQSLEKTLSLGMAYSIQIHTPLMHLTKAESIKLADELDAFESLKISHTCYQGTFPPCEKCPSCILRKKGFEEAGYKDPLLN